MLFAARTPRVFTACVQGIGQHGVAAKSGFVHANGFFGNVKNANAFNAGRRAGKVFVDGFAGNTNGLEQLRTAVAHVGGDAHLGHDLGQAFAHRLDVVVDGFFRRQITGEFFVNFHQGFHRQIGVNGLGTIARQHTKVVHFAGGTGLHHQASTGAQALNHQMLVNRAQGQQSGDGHLAGADGTVADDDDIFATFDRIHCFGTERSEFGFDPFVTPAQGVGNVQRVAAELALGVLFNVAQLGHIGKVQHGLRHFQAHGRVDLVDVQ